MRTHPEVDLVGEHDEALLQAAGILAQVVLPAEVPLQVRVVSVVPARALF